MVFNIIYLLQFEKGILDICLKILDDNPKFVSDADKDCSARRNPVYVTRVLSAMVGVQVSVSACQPVRDCFVSICTRRDHHGALENYFPLWKCLMLSPCPSNICDAKQQQRKSA